MTVEVVATTPGFAAVIADADDIGTAAAKMAKSATVLIFKMNSPADKYISRYRTRLKSLSMEAFLAPAKGNSYGLCWPGASAQTPAMEIDLSLLDETTGRIRIKMHRSSPMDIVTQASQRTR
jgi:hypothetical protein